MTTPLTRRALLSRLGLIAAAPVAVSRAVAPNQSVSDLTVLSYPIEPVIHFHRSGRELARLTAKGDLIVARDVTASRDSTAHTLTLWDHHTGRRFHYAHPLV